MNTTAPEQHFMTADTPEQYKALVRQYLIALGSLDGAKAREYMHDDYACEIINAAIRPGTFDAKGFCRFLAGVDAVLSTPIEFDFIEMTAEGNRVSTVANGFATTIDGTPYNNRYHFLNHVEGGKVIRHLEFLDSYLARKVLGPIMARLGKSK